MAFKKVENNNKYLKITIFGDAGTGKTTLAETLAIGLAKAEKKNKIHIIDTEGGMDFFADHLKEEGIECYSSDVIFNKYEKFTDELASVFKENPTVLIIDSISLIGELLQAKFVTGTGNTYAQWGKAKADFSHKVTRLIQNAPFHVIVCGREAKGEGDLSEKKTSNGGGLDYDTHMLIRMTREMKGEIQIRVAQILKDKVTAGLLDGKKFKNPTFDDFKPAIDKLLLSQEPDTELFKEMKNKLLTCNDAEFFDIITESLKIIAQNGEIPEKEMTQLRKLYAEIKEKFPSKKASNENAPIANINTILANNN